MFNREASMRDLLYKNLTFLNRGQKIISSREIADKEGVHSVVRRHFTYIIKQVENSKIEKQAPYLYILKEKNTKNKKERFFCKIKGNLIAENNGKLLHILFVHTLSVELTASTELKQQII
jgi:hypothetical protein